MRRSETLSRIAGQDVYEIDGCWLDPMSNRNRANGLTYVTETLTGWRQVELYRRPGREDGVRLRPIVGDFLPDHPLPWEPLA
jgi:hypothetical protein